MSSKLSGKVRNLDVSMSNIKSWIETGLRQMKAIRDDVDVNITFSTVSDQMKVIDWEVKETVPIQVQYLKKGVQVIKFG